MHRGEAFVDVLERELGRAVRPEPRAASASQTRRPLAASPFLFATRPPLAPSAVRAPQPVRPARVLAPRQRRALRELIALGADLHAGFTAHELRHAFRVLARRYHPDAHPDKDANENARLSRTFAELAENHRCLLAVVEPVGPIRH
jgi:hypothetical protein